LIKMEKFKEDIFTKEAGKKLIYEPVSSDELSELTYQLEKKYGIKTNSRFFVEARKVLTSEEVFSVEIEGNDLRGFIFDKYPNEETVFVIWDYPQQIDKFELNF